MYTHIHTHTLFTAWENRKVLSFKCKQKKQQSEDSQVERRSHLAELSSESLTSLRELLEFTHKPCRGAGPGATWTNRQTPNQTVRPVNARFNFLHLWYLHMHTNDFS